MFARNRLRIPSLRLHKPSGRAVVTVRGRDIYCGPYGSSEADERHRQVVAEMAYRRFSGAHAVTALGGRLP